MAAMAPPRDSPSSESPCPLSQLLPLPLPHGLLLEPRRQDCKGMNKGGVSAVTRGLTEQQRRRVLMVLVWKKRAMKGRDGRSL